MFLSIRYSLNEEGFGYLGLLVVIRIGDVESFFGIECI